MKVYQVLNENENPISDELNSLSIFRSKEDAEKYISFLTDELHFYDKFKIVEKELI